MVQLPGQFNEHVHYYTTSHFISKFYHGQNQKKNDDTRDMKYGENNPFCRYLDKSLMT